MKTVWGPRMEALGKNMKMIGQRLEKGLSVVIVAPAPEDNSNKTHRSRLPHVEIETGRQFGDGAE